MDREKKICLIGAGNMGGALARGIVRGGYASAEEICLTARSESTLAPFRDEGFRTTTDNRQAVRNAGMVMIAVKPAAVPSVLEEIRDSLDFGNQIVVCIAAGIKPETFDRILGKRNGKAAELVYLIPNTPIETGRGVNFIAPVHASEQTVEKVCKALENTGRTIITDLDMLGAGMALASCGTAYAMKYIGTIAAIGAKMGFDSAEALEIACDTVGGAAALLQYRKSSPSEEIRRVATPGGYTERGLKAMDKEGFTAALEAAHEKLEE